jgi:hypothetical protein
MLFLRPRSFLNNTLRTLTKNLLAEALTHEKFGGHMLNAVKV